MAPANKRNKQSAPSPRAYCGELYYTDTDVEIEVSRFIVSKDRVAFDLITEWDLGGRWRFCSDAELLPDGAFLSDYIEGTAMIGPHKTVPVRFRFEIKKQSDLRIQICGILSLQGEANSFAGKLKKFTAKHS